MMLLSPTIILKNRSTQIGYSDFFNYFVIVVWNIQLCLFFITCEKYFLVLPEVGITAVLYQAQYRQGRSISQSPISMKIRPKISHRREKFMFRFVFKRMFFLFYRPLSLSAIPEVAAFAAFRDGRGTSQLHAHHVGQHKV